jgi:hypothetical protein
MNFIRSLLLAVVAGLCLVGGTLSQVEAGAPAQMTKSRYYAVYYRYGPHDCWHFYHSYQSYQTAVYVANVLHYWYGVDTFVR